MKKVEAIIRPEQLDSVLEELEKIGYPGLTISEVRGHGKQKGVTHQWRGNEYTVRLLDEDEGRTVDVIVRKARTGSIGDGKIFVSDVGDAVRVRTGDSGTRAI
jgi:nitrogen regulatory protein P-II 1